MSRLLIIILAILGISMLVITIANYINLVLFLVPVAHNEWGWSNFWQTDNFWVWVIAFIILIGGAFIARLLVKIINLVVMLSPQESALFWVLPARMLRLVAA